MHGDKFGKLNICFLHVHLANPLLTQVAKTEFPLTVSNRPAVRINKNINKVIIS